MTNPAYNDPSHRAAVKALKAAPDTLCWHGCGRRATTIDHNPPLALHQHQRGTGCCTSHPACKPCQDRQGATIANNQGTGYDWP